MNTTDPTKCICGCGAVFANEKCKNDYPPSVLIGMYQDRELDMAEEALREGHFEEASAMALVFIARRLNDIALKQDEQHEEVISQLNDIADRVR